jgi:hypothetical protein
MDPRPIPGDPGAEQVVAMFNANDDPWYLSAGGDMQSCAVETMANDGGDFQRVVAMEIPVRLNHTDERSTFRLMIDPVDALQIAEHLCHTAGWMLGLEP